MWVSILGRVARLCKDSILYQGRADCFPICLWTPVLGDMRSVKCHVTLVRIAKLSLPSTQRHSDWCHKKAASDRLLAFPSDRTASGPETGISFNRNLAKHTTGALLIESAVQSGASAANDPGLFVG